MSFSRFSVLAVFLMMVMSAFVALPTYNVGADEHEGGGPYLNAFPTGSGGDIEDYEKIEENVEGANITVEATELVDGTSYTIFWDIWDATYTYGTEGYWVFSGGSSSASVQYFIGPDILNSADFPGGCYMFTGWLYDDDASVEIENETWPFTIGVPFSDCEEIDDCPFMDGPDSPCGASECEDHESDACDDYVTDYCDTHADDPGCTYSADDCPFDDREGTPCEAEVCQGEDHESEECNDYVESYCAANDDPGCYFGPPGPGFICGNGDEIPFEWVNDGEEDCSDGSDEQQYDAADNPINWFDCHDGSEVWVYQVNDGYEDCPDGEDEGYGGDDYDDFGPSEAHIDVHMIDLANWEAYAAAAFDPMWSNDMRAEIAHMCAEMMGTSDTEITLDCFNEWVAMTEDGPGGGEPDRGCPHDMDENTCDDFREACGPDSSSKLTCFRMIFDYCDDHDDEMCHEGIASEDDGGPLFEALFAYEDEEIDSDEFLDILTEWIYGERGGDPALYDTHTFTITTDDEGFYSLHPNFGSYSEGGHSFICGNGDEIPFEWVNNDAGDCPDGADEQWYDSWTNDTSDDCQMWNDADCEGNYVNWFDCHDGSEIWIVEVNNDYHNCSYGEDEAYEGGSDHWYGHVFLYTGSFADVPDSTENLVGAAVDVCGYADETTKVDIHCESTWEGLLAAGDYTVVTAGTCYYEWTDEDGDGEYDESDELTCHDYGDYTLVITNETGDVVDEIDGTVEYDLNHTMVMTHEHYDLREESSNSFPLYDTHAFTVGTDGFNGAIVSAQYQCYDHDDDGVDDDCYSADMALYLYEGSFDPADTYANILGSNDDVWDDGLDCPVGDEPEYFCMYSRLEVELSAGDYVVVTAGYDTWSEGYYVNDIVTDDGTIIESWDGKLKGYYWDCCDDDGNETLVEGDERTHMPRAWEYSDDDGEFFFNSIVDNLDEYLDGTLTADVAAGNIVSIFHEADAEGVFNDGDDSHCDDGHCDDSHCEDGHCGGDSHCDDGHCGEEHHCDDGHCDAGDGPHEDECPFTDQETCEELQYLCNDEDDGGNPVMCGWEVAHYCLENEDSGCDEVETACTSPVTTENASICAAYNDFDHDAYHDETDDEPVTLDGIEGVEDPDDWGDMMTFSSENIVGNLADNEGLPIFLEQSFTITFDEIYPDNANHVLVIPSNADPDEEDYDDDGFHWQITFRVTEAYQINSCTGCDDISVAMYSDDGREISFTMNDDATHDIAITFSFAEPEPELPDCDHVVGIDASGFAFDLSDLDINVGETVCWQWDNAVDQHNVVEIIGEFDATMNLTEVSVGFSSGEPSNDVDFRHTFTEDDKTHYYVCDPHASMGMVGKITVGEGTPDDPVEEAIEESGLPSVGFVVGALVLVGAAGLRRRIH